jgi:hypothetical protein
MQVEYNINKVQDMSYPLAQYGLLDVHSPVAPGLTAGTSRNPKDLLVSGSGYQNIITTDLVHDPLLTVDNLRYFQKISKEMYQFTMVSHDYSSTIILCQDACLSLSLYAGCGQTLTTKI